MVTVPYTPRERLRVPMQVQENTPRAMEAAQNTPQAFGSQVGQALTQVSAGIADVAEAIDFRDQIKAKADSDDAFGKYMDVRRSILRDPDEGYLNQTGGNALDGRGDMLERMQKARSSVEEGLSPRARKAFAERADALDQQAKETAIVHESQQLRSYSTNSAQAAITASLEEAGLHYDNQKASDEFLGEALRETRAQAALEGWPPEQLNNQLAAITSEVTVNRAIRLASVAPADVEAFIDANIDRMLPNAAHDLRTKLKPIIVEAKARQIVDPMLAGISGDDDQYGRPKWLVAAESGGDPNAENPLSSAAGSVQFLEGTYLEWVQRVNPEWAQGLSRSEILATRGDPKKEGQIYRAFRKGNADQLKGAGYEITPRNEYIMHHMGAGTGLALLQAEKENPGQTLRALLVASEGQTRADLVMKQNPHLRGRSLRSALNFFESKAGGNRVVRNPSEAYRKALEIKDPDVREAAIALIDSRMAVSSKAEKLEQEAAMDDAYEQIVTNGTMPEDLPIEQQLLLGPSGMATMRTAAQAQATGTDIHNEQVYLDLYDMANSTDAAMRQEFIDRNLNDEAANLSQSALLGLKNMQVEMRSLVEERKGATPGDYIYDGEDFPKVYNQVKDQYQAATGYRPSASSTKKEAERWVHFTSQLKQAMIGYANENGSAMPQSLIDQTVGMLLTPAIIDAPGLWNKNDKANLFDAPFRAKGASVELAVEAEQIPIAERERLTNLLTTAYGRPPTEDEVVEHYEVELLTRNGLLPEMEFEDIPKDLRTALRAEYPDASEEQIIDLFMTTVKRRIQTLGE